MQERLIPFTTELGFTRLFREFSESPDTIRQDFGLPDIASAITAVSSHQYNRDALVEVLSRQNGIWGMTEQTATNIAKLKDEKSVVVAVGQQACLFGGPYFVILKALTAIKKAATIEEQFNIPAVPVFWIASDDHDFAEISFAEVFDRAGRISRVGLEIPEQDSLPPVGAMSFDESIEQVRGQFIENFPENDFYADVTGLVERHYTGGTDITAAFAGVMQELLGQYGLVLFSPYDKEFKQYVSGVMSDIVTKHGAVKDAIRQANDALDAAGYHQQVVKADSAVNLFVHTPNRQALHVDGKHFTAGEKKYSQEELLNTIHEHPLDFSPDVLMRPIMQSAFMPVASFIGGPAEVAYFVQLSNLFSVFDLPTPELQGRASATIVEARFEKLLDDENIKLVALASDGEKLITEAVINTFPDEVEREFSKIREDVGREIEVLDKLAERIDKSLIDAVKKSCKNIDKEFAEMHKRLINAHKKQNRVTRERLERLYENLYPRRQPAERVVNIAYFISRYGTKVIDFLYKNVLIDAKGHQVLMLSDYNG